LLPDFKRSSKCLPDEHSTNCLPDERSTECLPDERSTNVYQMNVVQMFTR